MPPGGQLENAVSNTNVEDSNTYTNHQYFHSRNKGDEAGKTANPVAGLSGPNVKKLAELAVKSGDSRATELAFQQQIAVFLILEFGVSFHNVWADFRCGWWRILDAIPCHHFSPTFE